MKRTIIYTGFTIPEIDDASLTGVVLFHFPTIKVIFESSLSFQLVFSFLKREPYLVFMSKNSVKGMEHLLKQNDKSLRDCKGIAWSVGIRTSGVVKEAFGLSALVPRKQNAQGLINSFKTLTKRPVLLITGRSSVPDFPDWLRENKWDFLKVPVYKTKVHMNKDLQKNFKNRRFETIFFSSPSTVDGFLISNNLSDFSTVKSNLASIGASTSKAIHAKQGQVYYEAAAPNVKRILKTLAAKIRT